MMLMLMLSMSLFFLFMKHPMTMGLILLLQTILTALMSGFINLNYWFSYIIFLIMIGGLLVLFIYMTSIASNELFYYSTKLMLYLAIIVLMNILIIMMFKNTFLTYNFSWNENFMNYFNFFYLKKFFNFPSIHIITMIILYLFITLIAVVKITMIKMGPLRINN
uniref:NADH-ubiquinone oxidoreductase chain 6 n=1 Tax=Staphylinoidea sp. 6 KM-2017 TaxID=2219460 RepID=A0A346RJU9_9COLE|nr:NADH dehydrogenase subunit 6 [Staphylinoidea sp. 6 KM-2017]